MTYGAEFVNPNLEESPVSTRFGAGVRLVLGVAVALVLLPSSIAVAQAAASKSHALKWGPAPAVFKKGMRMAVVSGDPSAKGPFEVRLAMPNGYSIAPHFHPTDEHIKVRSGVFLVGMGDVLDLKKARRLTRGDTITAPATMHHYAAARGATVLEITGTGPFQLTYVNASDLPKP